MRVAYKPLVDRFNIPRPTLIEWQKKSDKKDWRTDHLSYLRQQLLIEDETLNEINMQGINLHEYFLWSVFIFFENQSEPLPKLVFAQKLRNFAIANEFGVEYQHPFAKMIWNEVELDGKKVRIANYVSLLELSYRLTSAQYYYLQSVLIGIVKDIKRKLGYKERVVLFGLTWQELYALEKAFSHEIIKKELLEHRIVTL